jgi:hypothetical protein
MAALSRIMGLPKPLKGLSAPAGQHQERAFYSDVDSQ